MGKRKNSLPPNFDYDNNSPPSQLKSDVKAQMMECLVPVYSLLEGIKESIEFQSKQHSDLLNAFKEFKQQSESKIMALERKISEQNKIIDELKKEKTDAVLKEKKNNVVIFGIPEVNDGSQRQLTPIEFYEKTINQIQTKLGINTPDYHIADVFRMGKGAPNRPRPIKLKFISEQKKSLFYSAYLVRREELTNAGFRIRDDLTDEVRRFRREAYPFLVRFRNAGLQVRFWQDTLVVFDNQGRRADLKTLEDINRFKPISAD